MILYMVANEECDVGELELKAIKYECSIPGIHVLQNRSDYQ